MTTHAITSRRGTRRQDFVTVLTQVGRSEQRIADILDDRVRQALDEFPSHHPFMGAVVSGNVPTVILQATNDLPAPGSPRLNLFPCAWTDTVLGTSLTLLLSGSRGSLSQCWVYRGDHCLQDLERGVLNVIFVKHKHPVRAVRLDYTVAPEVAAVWTETLKAVAQDSSALLDDRLAHYWEVLADVNLPLSRRDRLQVGWAGAYRSAVKALADSLAEAKDVALPGNTEASQLPPDLDRFLELARSGTSAVPEVIQLLAGTLLQGTFPAFLSDYVDQVGDYDPVVELRQVVFLAHKCAALSTAVTECGIRVLGDERPESRRVPFLQLNIDQLPVAPEGYWSRIEAFFNWPWGDILTIADIPMRREEMANGWSDFRADADVAELSEAADTLIREAVTCKKWTIPPQAVVQLPIGPFRTVDFPSVPMTVRQFPLGEIM